ncbi:MAG: hypothetical protein P4L99_28475 [Chthoniobacter sp.]|nr:hypothetical protein [Chthoniobacter sp.]
MKRNILLGTLTVILASACGKAPQTSDAPSSPEPERHVATTPAPTAAAPAPVATPEPNHLAPEGVFFLTEKVNVEKKDGIIGYPAGTKVVRMGGGFVTPDGEKIAPRPDQMTNDLRIAQQAAGNDAAAQAAVKSTLASIAQAASAGASTPLPPGVRSTTYSTVTTGPNGTQTVRETTHTTTVDPVTAQLRELDKQRQLLELQIGREHEELRSLTVKNPRKSPDAERINQEIAALREKIRVINEQSAVLRASR